MRYETPEQVAVKREMGNRFASFFRCRLEERPPTDPIDFNLRMGRRLWAFLECKDRRGDGDLDIDAYDDWFIESHKVQALNSAARLMPWLHRLFAFRFASGIYFLDVRDIADLPEETMERRDRGDPLDTDTGLYVPADWFVEL